jgi:hypothetical protein
MDEKEVIQKKAAEYVAKLRKHRANLTAQKEETERLIKNMFQDAPLELKYKNLKARLMIKEAIYCFDMTYTIRSRGLITRRFSEDGAPHFLAVYIIILIASCGAMSALCPDARPLIVLSHLFVVFALISFMYCYPVSAKSLAQKLVRDVTQKHNGTTFSGDLDFSCEPAYRHNISVILPAARQRTPEVVKDCLGLCRDVAIEQRYIKYYRDVKNVVEKDE